MSDLIQSLTMAMHAGFQNVQTGVQTTHDRLQSLAESFAEHTHSVIETASESHHSASEGDPGDEAPGDELEEGAEEVEGAGGESGAAEPEPLPEPEPMPAPHPIEQPAKKGYKSRIHRFRRRS